MANRDENSKSDSERLQELDATTANNKKILLLILGLAVVTAVIAITLGVVRLISPPSSFAHVNELVQIQTQVAQMQAQVKEMQEKNSALQFELDSSQAAVFKAMMLEQERSYQLHLNALKQGMRDLARMIPSSRTWLDIYDEQMDTAIEQSKARMNKLATVQTNTQQKVIEAVPVPARPEPVQVNTL